LEKKNQEKPGFPRIVCPIDNKIEQLLAEGVPQVTKIPEDDAHHLVHVLRRNIGDNIWLLDPQARTFYAAVIEQTTPYVSVKLINKLSYKHSSSYIKVLLFALCKGEKNDFIAEKSCELGVEHVVFWQAQNSVVKIKSGFDAQKKIDRWNKISLSAAKQCGNSLITKCHFSSSIDEAIDLIDNMNVPQKYFAALTPEKIELSELKDPANTSALVIGPEGDLNSYEVKILLEKKFTPVGLGPFVLRAETAAIAAVSGFNTKWAYRS
jgi:16S rRNA (uracil1498-N3)-methyltransferase